MGTTGIKTVYLLTRTYFDINHYKTNKKIYTISRTDKLRLK
jgi:hypothetical protein